MQARRNQVGRGGGLQSRNNLLLIGIDVANEFFEGIDSTKQIFE